MTFRILFAAALLSPPLALQAAAPALQRVVAARIVAAARAQLEQKLGAEQGSAKIAVIGTPEDVMVPVGALSMQMHTLQGHWPRSRIGVPVDICVNGRVIRSATVWFALDLQRPVLSYSADTKSGTSAASLKLASRDADVVAVQGDLIDNPHELDGMRLRHPVVAGAAVVREDFERIPAIDPGERVQVRVVSGPIQLQARGTAANGGNVDDVVSVLVDDAQAPVHARILGKGVVEVVQ